MNKINKIVHITTVHPQNDNRIFYKECISLKDAGYDVSLIVAGTENSKVNGINIYGLKKCNNRILRVIKTSFFDLLRLCNKVEADVYHFHDPEIMFAAIILKLKGKKVVYDIHENTSAAILSKPYLESKILKYFLSQTFHYIERFCVRFFDALVVARPDIANLFKHSNMIVLRNFPVLSNSYTSKGEVMLKKSKPSVIYVGGMSSIRGINQLLEAFETLDDYELWLLGPIAEKRLERKIKSGCRNVKYLGVVEAFEVFDYIKMADIGIITFLPVPNHINTLATKPFEYMASGKPMIMSNFPYWKSTFRKSSLYVNPLDIQEIKETISNLMNDPILLRNMQEINISLSKNEYNWETESHKLLNLYSDILLLQ